MDWLMWFVYAIDVLGSIDETFGFAAGVLILVGSLLVAMALTAFDGENPKEPEKIVGTFGKRMLYVGVFMAIIVLLVPTKQTMYTMLAIKAVDVVIETDAVQTLVPKSVEVVEEYLNGVLNDLREQNNVSDSIPKSLDDVKSRLPVTTDKTSTE